jgi:retinol dehydrogenase 12
MNKSATGSGKVLITGGTSGLGFAIVNQFLDEGYDVVATGRNLTKTPSCSTRFTFIKTDFGDLKQTSRTLKKVCRDCRFDIVINNAGVLGKPEFLFTDDGFEYTFQVNFLAHLLINEIILNEIVPDRPLKIAAVISPVYRIADKELAIRYRSKEYKPFKAYSGSKLLLALMCSYLPLKYPNYNLRCICYDPGVFRSEIFRMQKEWFRVLYRIAAPVMRDPAIVAREFYHIIRKEDLVNGIIYKSDKRTLFQSGIDKAAVDSFWMESNEIIKQYLE